ncbi:MAG: hypothetical protein JWQ49_6100, partial [Edaphobacter sp.]|nr:hypothetical protein [Edaphobacter sp.]
LGGRNEDFVSCSRKNELCVDFLLKSQGIHEDPFRVESAHYVIITPSTPDKALPFQIERNPRTFPRTIEIR